MKNILVVDDSKFMREIIKKAITDLELTIFEADCAEKALEILKENQIDIMTLDVTMGGKSGAESIGDFLAIRPDLKIFVCSSMTSTDMIQKTLLSGARDFIKKPFKNDVLRKKISDAM